MKTKLYINMHGAEARARFLELSCAELPSHAPKTLFFAMKNNDFIITSILHENEAIRKYARRWGRSTIFGIIQTGTAAPCSQHPIFLQSKTMIVYLPQKLLITGLKGDPKTPQVVGNEISRT